MVSFQSCFPTLPSLWVSVLVHLGQRPFPAVSGDGEAILAHLHVGFKLRFVLFLFYVISWRDLRVRVLVWGFDFGHDFKLFKHLHLYEMFKLWSRTCLIDFYC